MPSQNVWVVVAWAMLSGDAQKQAFFPSEAFVEGLLDSPPGLVDGKNAFATSLNARLKSAFASQPGSSQQIQDYFSFFQKDIVVFYLSHKSNNPQGSQG